MSGVLKSVGKVFKKVVKSKIFKVVAIAAAVYFTAGIASAALGSTFAAGLPMIGEAAGMLGVTGGALGGAAGAAASAAGMASIEGSMMAGIGGMTAEAGSPFIAGAGAIGEAAAPIALSQAGGAAGGAASGGVSGGVNNLAKIATGNPFNLSDPAMKILGQGIATGGKAMLDAIGQKAALDQRREEIQWSREDAAKKGSRFDMSNTYRKPYESVNTNTSSGIVNAVGGP